MVASRWPRASLPSREFLDAPQRKPVAATNAGSGVGEVTLASFLGDDASGVVKSREVAKRVRRVAVGIPAPA